MVPLSRREWSSAIVASGLFAVLRPLGADETPTTEGKNAVEVLHDFTERFRKGEEGWLGADAIYSVVLPDGRLVWVFDDTFIGKLVDGKRQVSQMVNNTLAVQKEARLEAPLQLVVRRGEDGKAQSFVVPAQGDGWFWQCAAVADAGKLHVFCQRVVKADSKSEAFGFAIVGTELISLGETDKALAADPNLWKSSQQSVPGSGKKNEQLIIWGAGAVTRENHHYVLGTREKTGRGLHTKELILARAEKGKLADLASWQFWDGSHWQSDADKCASLAKDVANELSVSFDAKLNSWIMVHSEKMLAPGIMIRTAKRIEGPWSEPKRIYRAPEADFDKRIFCYAAKGHAAVSKPGELVISYVTNSHEFAHAINDNRVYWPIFIKADLTKLITP